MCFEFASQELSAMRCRTLGTPSAGFNDSDYITTTENCGSYLPIS